MQINISANSTLEKSCPYINAEYELLKTKVVFTISGDHRIEEIVLLLSSPSRQPTKTISNVKFHKNNTSELLTFLLSLILYQNMHNINHGYIFVMKFQFIDFLTESKFDTMYEYVCSNFHV